VITGPIVIATSSSAYRTIWWRVVVSPRTTGSIGTPVRA
jgi:hypothetical protein